MEISKMVVWIMLGGLSNYMCMSNSNPVSRKLTQSFVRERLYAKVGSRLIVERVYGDNGECGNDSAGYWIVKRNGPHPKGSSSNVYEMKAPEYGEDCWIIRSREIQACSEEKHMHQIKKKFCLIQ